MPPYTDHDRECFISFFESHDNNCALSSRFQRTQGCSPAMGNLGDIQNSSVPKEGFSGPIKIADNVWIVRRLFSLGADQTMGLTWTGLRDRLLGLLGEHPMDHPSLDMMNNESTMEQLKEERERVRDITNGITIPFPLDSTMTIIRKDGNLTLHSVVPMDRHLIEAIRKLGKVTLFLAPNLQHWLFLNDWLNEFPNASIGLVPSAFDEDLNTKITKLGKHQGNIVQLKTGTEAELKNFGLVGKLLEGAPLSLNEYLFFHVFSGTLIASDSFYV